MCPTPARRHTFFFSLSRIFFTLGPLGPPARRDVPQKISARPRRLRRLRVSWPGALSESRRAPPPRLPRGRRLRPASAPPPAAASHSPRPAAPPRRRRPFAPRKKQAPPRIILIFSPGFPGAQTEARDSPDRAQTERRGGLAEEGYPSGLPLRLQECLPPPGARDGALAPRGPRQGAETGRRTLHRAVHVHNARNRVLYARSENVGEELERHCLGG